MARVRRDEGRKWRVREKKIHPNRKKTIEIKDLIQP